MWCDKTLVKSTISQNENELSDYTANRNYYLNLEYNMLLTKSNYLQNLKEDFISYESCIIKKIFWEFCILF